MAEQISQWLESVVRQHRLSGGQSRVVRALLASPENFILVSVKEFAAAAEVAPATVTRCIRFLGFSSYAAFQQQLKERLLHPQKLTSVYNYLEKDAVCGEISTALILDAEKDTLAACLEAIDSGTLAEAAAMVARSRRVHIIGYGSSVALLRFLQYRLMRIGLDVVDMTPVSQLNMLAEHCVHMTPRNDVILTVSFRGVYETITHLLHFARAFHIPSIAFSENPDSDISRLSGVRIPIRRAVIDEFKSLAAPMSIMNLFVMQVARCLEPKKETINRRLAWFRKYQKNNNLIQIAAKK